MNCKKKLTLAVVITMILTIVVTGLAIEYMIQNDKYDDSVIETVITSAVMNEERPIIIHLPEDYNLNKAKTYPVMYVLDGSSQDKHTAFKMDLLSKVKLFPEAIVVGIPNTRGNRSRDFTPHYMKIDLEKRDSDLGNGALFLKFLETEVIPFINANYSANGFSSLSGNSRGGLFVFYALLERPKLFDAYLCYSPAFWRENQLIVKKAASFFEQHHDLNTFIYMSLGDLENEKMKKSYDAMITLIMEQELSELKFKNQITKNANHQTNAYKSTIYALEWLGSYLLNKKKSQSR